ncbi:Anthrax toxin LF subunit [Thalassoglobus neptunius]|uniref:Anthrax toxin LF subunit n=1 Tax=Thalassoglobus neptunius TaxID=1938619 RepID=A0A5C5WEP1_9PLAN|nr:hypothetical protein [Thalassoglobus neptunius]TWT48212.1 Anthrax toxin LF subunit [Thalassoglobus neptunius]
MGRKSASGCGMNSAHQKIFFQVARSLKVWILVRATNPESLQFIGPGYPDIVPKPLLCKAKTAETGPHAGLVVCPMMVPDSFSVARFDRAVTTWNSWAPKWVASTMEQSFRKEPEFGAPIDFMQKLYPGIRRDGLPDTYGVIDSEYDPRYGCVVLLQGGRRFLIHGDYDLYDVIDPADPRDISQFVRKVNGAKSAYGRRTQEVQKLLNQGLGADMVQHGEDLAWYGSHSNDMILGFSPDPSVKGLLVVHSFGQGPRAIERVFREAFEGRKPGGSHSRD